ncbi:Uncharacterised protein [Phocoenobacter uteri]|uniref:Uncharacterized protein n=1 Tax=Phocoenobacter uteri TaxID=146806 RepID=A0A379CBN4_9PAST|nr:Uncharacterised protein [Phocoenobacter uteri]
MNGYRLTQCEDDHFTRRTRPNPNDEDKKNEKINRSLGAT